MLSPIAPLQGCPLFVPVRFVLYVYILHLYVYYICMYNLKPVAGELQHRTCVHYIPFKNSKDESGEITQ